MPVRYCMYVRSKYVMYTCVCVCVCVCVHCVCVHCVCVHNTRTHTHTHTHAHTYARTHTHTHTAHTHTNIIYTSHNDLSISFGSQQLQQLLIKNYDSLLSSNRGYIHLTVKQYIHGCTNKNSPFFHVWITEGCYC